MVFIESGSIGWFSFDFRHREAHVNQYNAARQHAVNAAAEHYGAGTGTAAHYGVPGEVFKKNWKHDT